MRTTAKLERKEKELITQQCQIDKIVDLSSTEYWEFSHNLLMDYEFIWDFKDEMYVDREGVSHCMLVLGEKITDGILVEGEGAGYARYSAILPNARAFIDSQVRRIINFIVSESVNNTEDGNWFIKSDELERRFHTTIKPGNGIFERLSAEIQKREEVISYEAAKDGFRLSCHLSYCQLCKSENKENSASLNDLMKCNLEDVHLLDSDEEHDCATIVELNQNTLTDEGKHDWADVLGAKVEKIYTGYYGLQINVSGCSPERLRDFSYMLAGQCLAKDYDRWVTSGTEHDDMEMK